MIFQAATPAKGPDPVVHRELKNKQVHRLRVHISLTRDGGDDQTIDYDLEATTDTSKNAGDGATLDFKISDYVFRAHEQVSQKKLIGTGKINVTETGLPETIMDSISDTHFWYPLICLYLPEQVTGGEFTVDDPLGTRVALKGTGHLNGNSYDMSGTMDRGAEQIAKYKLEWKIDRRGWVTKADGEITDLDGTVQFTVRGR